MSVFYCCLYCSGRPSDGSALLCKIITTKDQVNVTVNIAQYHDASLLRVLLYFENDTILYVYKLRTL